ncbi:MAG TPA: peptidylprolyl isomerase [Anaerolineae bacterium]|nr:peptidylprolyl isomerase [Anaerolineae bacterium]
MAKRKVKQDISPTRKQVSRREKERRQRLILIGVAAAIGCLILAILGFGAYQELVGKPAAPVAKVNGVPLGTNFYQKRVRLERMMFDANIEMMRTQRSLYDPEVDIFMLSIIDQQISQLSVQRDLLNTESFVDGLIQEELIRQAAQEAGVSVSPQEIDRQIEQEFGYSQEEPTAVPSPSTDTITSTAEISPTEVPTPMTRARFEELYGDFLTNLKNGTGLSEAEYRDIVEVTLLGGKMEEYVGQQVPTSEPQIRVRHILLDTEEEAQAVLQRLEDGEDFAALATEVSTDTVSAEMGGDLGWIPKGEMDTAFDEVAFNLPVGEISDVVETPRGFHIILVEERDDDRELDAEILDQRRRDTFQVWLVDLEAEAEIERFWSADKVPPE